MAKKTAPASKRRAKAPEPSRAGAIAAGTLSLGAIAGVLAAGVFGLRRLARRAPGGGEHVPTDLMGETRPSAEDRAPADFRPDPTAPIPASERDAFRPALGGAQAPG